MVTAWYSQIDRLSTPALQRLFRGGASSPSSSTAGAGKPAEAETGS